MFYNPMQKPKLLTVSSKHFIQNSQKSLKLNVICNISIFPFLYAFTSTTLTIQTHLLLHKYRHRILLCTRAPYLYHTQSLHLPGYAATPAVLPGTTKLTPVSNTVHSIWRSRTAKGPHSLYSFYSKILSLTSELATKWTPSTIHSDMYITCTCRIVNLLTCSKCALD
jgi:hypothetical protein